MKVAVAYENGAVSARFDSTEHIKLYEVKGSAVLTSMTLEALGCGHEALASFLGGLHVSALICGGITGSARAAVEDAGIVLYGGVTGSADDAVAALLAGTLSYDPAIHLRGHEGCGDGSPVRPSRSYKLSELQREAPCHAAGGFRLFASLQFTAAPRRRSHCPPDGCHPA